MGIRGENIPAVSLLIFSMFILLTWVMVTFPTITFGQVSIATVSTIYTVLLIFSFIVFMVKAAVPTLPIDFIDLGNPQLSWLNIGIGVMAGVCFSIFLFSGATHSIVTFTITNSMQLLFVVLVAPTVEELFFRGTLLPTFSLYLSDPVGIVLSSGIFALYHIATWGATSIVGLIVPFIFAILLGTLTVKLQSIVPALIAHMTTNLILALIGMGGA